MKIESYERFDHMYLLLGRRRCPGDALIHIVSMGMWCSPLQRLIVLSGRRIEEKWSSRFAGRTF
jgi:hypothetical protein